MCVITAFKTEVKHVTDLSSSSHHANPDGAGGTRGVLQTRAALTGVGIFGVLLGKDVHSVGSHLLLGNKHLKKTLISKTTNTLILYQHIQEES